MGHNPFRVDLDPEKFNLRALKVQPATFWNYGYLLLLDDKGKERRFPLRALPTDSPIKFEIDASATDVMVLITGDVIICGEYEDQNAKSYSIVVSGPQGKIDQLQRSLLKDRGYIVLE